MLVLAVAVIFTLSSCAPYQARRIPTGQRERGQASWYGPGFAGKKTASGERFSPSAMTAAHKTLPLGTEVQVTNLENHKSVVVKINDRGPFVRGRIIDLSKGAAKKIDLFGMGTAMVEVAVLGPREGKGEAQDLSGDVEERSEMTDDASSTGTMDEVIAKSNPGQNKGVLLASNKHFKGKNKAKKAEAPVTRNGVAYLIEQDDANGGASADDEIAKAEKKSRPASRPQANRKSSFARIDTDTDAQPDEAETDSVEDVDSDNAADAEAENVKAITKTSTAVPEDEVTDEKVVESKRITDADEAIEKALQKLGERREAKTASVEGEVIPVKSKSASTKRAASVSTGKISPAKAAAAKSTKTAAKSSAAKPGTKAATKSAPGKTLTKTAAKPSPSKASTKAPAKAVAKATAKTDTKARAIVPARPASKSAAKAPARTIPQSEEF